MKKFIIMISLIIIVGTIGYFFIGYEMTYKYNPYAGKYISEKGNVILILNKDNNKCTIIYNEYRDVFSGHGKYFIKDNKIKIAGDKNKQGYLEKNILMGTFRGDTIQIDKDVYYKQ